MPMGQTARAVAKAIDTVKDTVKGRQQFVNPKLCQLEDQLVSEGFTHPLDKVQWSFGVSGVSLPSFSVHTTSEPVLISDFKEPVPGDAYERVITCLFTLQLSRPITKP